MWSRFGLSFLLLLSSVAAADEQLRCFPDTQKQSAGSSVSLSFTHRGSCAKGMVTIEANTPQGGPQVLVNSFKLPVTAVWFEDMDGDDEPDLLLQTRADDSAGELIVFRNQAGRLVHQWLSEPNEQQLQGYIGRDKLYPRWGKLVRLMRYQSDKGEAWRRLVYNFDSAAWQREI